MYEEFLQPYLEIHKIESKDSILSLFQLTDKQMLEDEGWNFADDVRFGSLPGIFNDKNKEYRVRNWTRDRLQEEFDRICKDFKDEDLADLTNAEIRRKIKDAFKSEGYDTTWAWALDSMITKKYTVYSGALQL